MAFSTFSPFAARGTCPPLRAGRNGAGVSGLGRVFLQVVFQIWPIEQVYFVVVQSGSKDIVIDAPSAVQLP